MALNNPEKGLADFNKAISMDEKLADAYFNRACIYHLVAAFKNQHPHQALQDYNKVTIFNFD